MNFQQTVTNREWNYPPKTKSRQRIGPPRFGVMLGLLQLVLLPVGVLSAEPGITSHPESQTNSVGASIVFNVVANGTAPLAYQWRRDSTNLADGGNISGALTDQLTLTNTHFSDAGNYAVVITNSEGAITSVVATLTVVGPPEIVSQPANLTNVVGAPGFFSVTATGTPPLHYQWWNGAGAVAAGTNALLHIFPISTNSNSYLVVITNDYGSLTSSVATLTVILPPVVSIGNGNDLLFFQGEVGPYPLALTNAYSGQVITVEAEPNVNTAAYDGLDGIDTLFLTNVGDLLTIRNVLGAQMIFNIERIICGDGEDLINLSDDTIVLGDMLVDGGRSNDVLWANSGNDDIRGREGNDLIDGGPGNDVIYGHVLFNSTTFEDDDLLFGGDGSDVIVGNSGTDLLSGEADDDTLHFFTDVVLDGSSTVTIPGYGIVSLSGKNGSYDTFDGGDGFDTLMMTNGSNAMVTRNASNTLVFIAMEQVNMGDGNDVFFVSDPASETNDLILYGGEGSDVIRASGGNDEIHGENDNDVIAGESGNDTIFGGAGDDQIVFLLGGGSDTVDGGADFDEILFGSGLVASNLTIVPIDDPTNLIFDIVVGTLGDHLVTTNVEQLRFDDSSTLSLTNWRTPEIAVQPESMTNTVGATVLFTVTATGAQPLDYQWRHDGTNLMDNGNVSGATTNELTLSNLGLSDAGNYDVVVANAYGSATSIVATLTVVVPAEAAGAPALDGSEFVMHFAGTPGVTYTVEYTDTIAPPNWQKATNLTAPGTNEGFGVGVFEFRETILPAGQRYYRAAYPAY